MPVAIYLDANVLFSWPTLTELERVALSAVASQMGQDVVVPSLVVDEAAAHRRRKLEGVVARYERAAAAVNKAFAADGVRADVEPFPDVDSVMDRWRRVLEQSVTIVETRGEHASEGLRREVVGQPPAKPRQPPELDDERKTKVKPGAGGRDAAIWVTIVDDVRRRGETAHFITNDSAFAEGETLRPEMTDEVAPLVVALHRSVSAFVAQFGQSVEARLPRTDLEQRAADAVRAAVAMSPEIGLAIWGADRPSPGRQRSQVHSASLESVSAIEGLEAADSDSPLYMADTIWELRLDLLYKDDGDGLEEDSWFVLGGCNVRIAAQIYVQADRAEVVGVQVLDSPSAYRGKDGSQIFIGRRRRDPYESRVLDD